MSKALYFGMHVVAYCQAVWPNDNSVFAHQASLSALSFATITSSGSHKYIPADRLSEELGLRQGRGIYGFLEFEDDSILLLCSDGRIAHWDADEESKPEFIGPVKPSELTM